MRTKIILFILFSGATLTINSVAQAQTPTEQTTTTQAPVILTPEQKLEMRLAHVAKRLHLTDAQIAQLRSVWEQSAPQIEADRNAVAAAAPGTPARKAARAQLAADLKARDMQMKPVLTPEQLLKFKRMMIRNLERRELRLQREERKLKE
jgi:Spy/CpxP family protein refolding chaperone